MLIDIQNVHVTLESNIQTNLGQPESGRLRFPLKIRVRAAGLGSRRSGHDLKQTLSPSQEVLWYPKLGLRSAHTSPPAVIPLSPLRILTA